MLFGKRQRMIRRLVIVEDEPLVAFENEYQLTEAGYEVVATVDSYADAARHIEHQEIHLVLTDISLRGDGDGTDVAKAAAQRSVPVLFISASCPLDARDLAVGCLAKPYNEKMLLAALEAVDAQFAGRKVKRLPNGLDLYRHDQD